MARKKSWSKALIKKLTNNPELVKIYVIPGVLFLLDFVVRGVLGIGLSDTGADMSLLAVATFISLLIEDINPRKYSSISIVFTIIFLSTWIICLRIVSIQNSMVFLSIDFRVVFSWFIGLTSFIFAGVIAYEIILDDGDTSS